MKKSLPCALALALATLGAVGAMPALAGPGGGGAPAAPAVGTITGTAIDPFGAPAAGATVRIYRTNYTIAATTSTNASGGFTVAGLAAGTYHVYVNRIVGMSVQQGNAFNVAVTGGGTATCTIQMFEIPIEW